MSRCVMSHDVAELSPKLISSHRLPSSPCSATSSRAHLGAPWSGRFWILFVFILSSAGPATACHFLPARGTPKLKSKPHKKRHLLHANQPGVPPATTLS